MPESARLAVRIRQLDQKLAMLEKKLDDAVKRLALEILGAKDQIDGLDAKTDARYREHTTIFERQTQLLESTNRAILIHGRILSLQEKRIGALEGRA